MAQFAFGLKSVKFGTPTGTSTMPVTVTDFAKTVKGSMTLSESEATVQDFFVEEQVAPVESIITEDSKMDIVWKCYDISAAIVSQVKGGTVVDGTTETTWKAPTGSVNIKLAIELTTESGVKILIPNASIIGRFDGTLGKADMLQMEVKATPLDPGDGGAAYHIVIPD
jgi:hypothetical protein